jgi:sugar phosphate isomerase/epimerase
VNLEPRALPSLGVTLYSFTRDYHAGRYTLEELVERVARDSLGPGLEIIGFQSFRGFPHMAREDERRFLEAVERHGLELSCLDGNVDVALRSDRFLDESELVSYLEAQIDAAARLGFPVLRIQNQAGPRVVERLLPHAERRGVKLGMEIHAPETVRSPWVLALRELYERLDSPFAGFIPDFGASTRGISPSMVEAFRAKGVSEELLREIQRRWLELDGREFEAHEEIGRFIALARDYGAGDHAVNLAVFAVGIHGHQDPRAWSEIMPSVVHVHGKFFDIRDGREPVVPLDELVDVLVAGGYRGFISSEYEGWHWDTESDAFEMVARQQAVLRAALDRHAQQGGGRETHEGRGDRQGAKPA